jgi:hypothetical protein
MNFEDFEPGDDATVVLKASEPDLNGTLRFLIGGQILTDRLGVTNPANANETVEVCEAQREQIVAACLRAFKRQPSNRVTLTYADFADEDAQELPAHPPTDVDEERRGDSAEKSPPQPPSDVGKEGV